MMNYIEMILASEALSQELPVIPKFVAEYLEFAKDNISLLQVLELASINGGSVLMKKEYDWISANDETFVRAWLYGYEADEEWHDFCMDSNMNHGQGTNG